MLKVPVKKDDIVTISYCYCAGFSINGEVDVYSNSGSTSLIESTQYIAKEDGFVTLTAKSQERMQMIQTIRDRLTLQVLL